MVDKLIQRTYTVRTIRQHRKANKMANVINTREQVKLLQSQGLTPKQIIQQFPKGTILHAQVEGILGIDCEEIDRDMDNLFEETA